jgi:LytR cell envelope-related transcriptional attenuator
MTVLPLALSLSSSFTEVGAIVAFVALLGIAILSLLVFSQAREIKRLREWAGRAPERAAEMEQRVSAEAAARLRGAGVTPAGAPAPARVVPRKTPLVSAPVSTAVNATVAAVVPVAAGAPATPKTVQGTPPPASSAEPQAEQNAKPAERGAAPMTEEAAPVPTVEGVSAVRAVQPVAKPADAGERPATSTNEPAQPPAEAGEGAERGPASAPATAAARAAGVAARAPLPPSPTSPRPASRPPAALAATRRTASRAVSARAEAPLGSGGPKYFKPERSPRRRAVALIVGGVIVGVLVLVFAVSALNGGGSKATATQSSSAGETQPASSHRKRTTHAVVTNPADTAVAVLNGTGTAGLAHHLAADLQQSGYSQAAALAGIPPGTHATTVVEYTHGHRADAQAVARSLNVTQVQAIESSIASLAGSATVVVLAGADQASQLGGGGAQSNGEPAAGGQ